MLVLYQDRSEEIGENEMSVWIVEGVSENDGGWLPYSRWFTSNFSFFDVPRTSTCKANNL